MAKLTLAEDLFLYPSPVGAYFCVSEHENNKSRQFLQHLLSERITPALSIDTLKQLMQTDDEEHALNVLHHCQKLGWIQGLKKPLTAPDATFEDFLPTILASFSSQKKSLLADEQGFYLGSQGFPHETAEELSALSAELAIIHKRRSGLLKNNLGLASQAWGIVDAYGNNQLGFWPLYIGRYRFMLIIAGTPFFNHPDFVSLVWTLSIRYAATTTESTYS